jgi:integrase/recombinase XerD
MNNNEEKMKLEDALEKFLRKCRIKNLADRTIEYYEEHCGFFFSYLEKEKPNIKYLQQLNQGIVEEYILYKKATGIKNTSINTELRAVRAFINFHAEKGNISSFKVDMLKTDKKVKETYSDEELKILLEKPNMDSCNFAKYRNWVTVNFLLGTAVRLKTLVNIKIKDVDLENSNLLLANVKNRKQQIIPISKSLNEILQEYLDIRKGEEEDYLFPTEHGKKMKKSSAIVAVNRYNKRRGVEKTSIHLFRHTFAKKWIKNGGDIFRLQKILGHSSMKVVREYVNMFNDDLKDNFDRFNPLEEFSDRKRYIQMKDD